MSLFFETPSSVIAIEKGLQCVVETILRGVVILASKIRTADIGKAGSMNLYGEQQLALDVLAEKVFEDELRKCDQIGLYASEELDAEVSIGDGDYGVAFDPLDGSSLVDVNFAVGSIFGIYKADTFVGTKGKDQVAVLSAIFGPRTTVMVSFGEGVFEYTLRNDGSFFCSHDHVVISHEAKIFAPGNLRACAFRKDYQTLVAFWLAEQYTLRYSGGMAPDINHILCKGGGIFTYPGYGQTPEGKLRLLFECAPMSFLVEQAGGSATDGTMRILDKQVRALSERTPILIGSKREVERAVEFLKDA